MKMYDAAEFGRTPPFLDLRPIELRKVLDLADARYLNGGAVIFNEGQPVNRFRLLMYGHVRFVKLTAEGDQIIMLHIQADQMFGIGAALGQLTHRTSAIAADDSLVLSWPNALWPVFCAALGPGLMK